MKKLLGLSLITLASLSFSKTIPITFQIINNTNLNTAATNQQQKTNAEDITTNINYNFLDYYYQSTADESSVYTLLNWKKYANRWENFNINYPTFQGSGLLIAGLQGGYPIKVDRMGVAKTGLLRYLPTKSIANFYITNTQGNLYTNVFIYLWYDDANIYWKWKATFKGNIKNFVGVQINSIVFKAAS